MLETHRQFRFKALLICLIIIIISIPIIVENDILIYLVSTTYTISLFLAIYVLAENKKFLIISLLLALPNFILALTEITIINQITTINLRLISQLAVDSFVIIFLLHYIFKTKQVTQNILYASVCIYLLLGIAWSICYTMAEINQPGSFAGIKNLSNLTDLNAALEYYLATFIYYSYITLTCVGYGNIYPLTPTSNAIAVMEALTGQLYMALLIGRLLGMHIAQKNKPDSK